MSLIIIRNKEVMTQENVLNRGLPEDQTVAARGQKQHKMTFFLTTM